MNTPKKYIEDKTADTLRAAIENEAKWIYYLTSEGIERGLDAGFAKDAMTELGEYYADTVYAECKTPAQVKETLMNRAMTLGFEAEAENEIEDGFDIKIGYCPMLNMWSQLCGEEEKKQLLCGVACSMYGGLAEKLGMHFEKGASIAFGCENCKLCFKK